MALIKLTVDIIESTLATPVVNSHRDDTTRGLLCGNLSISARLVCGFAMNKTQAAGASQNQDAEKCQAKNYREDAFGLAITPPGDTPCWMLASGCQKRPL
jgi:hypothetical protein